MTRKNISPTLFLLCITASLLLGALIGAFWSKSSTTTSDPSFLAELNNPSMQSAWPMPTENLSSAQVVAKLPQDMCPPNPDGPCGTDFIFLEHAGMIYVTTQLATGSKTYGPVGTSAQLLGTLKAVQTYVETLKVK